MTALDQIDGLLCQIAEVSTTVNILNAEAAQIMELAKARASAHVGPAKKALKQLEKQLEKTAKDHRREVFAEGDRREFTHGDLILQEGQRVVRAKCVTVTALQRLGYDDGVQITESVDWDTIDTWSAERLLNIGTERRRTTRITYDLKLCDHE